MSAAVEAAGLLLAEYRDHPRKSVKPERLTELAKQIAFDRRQRGYGRDTS